jgi:hypothetical protein
MEILIVVAVVGVFIFVPRYVRAKRRNLAAARAARRRPRD